MIILLKAIYKLSFELLFSESSSLVGPALRPEDGRKSHLEDQSILDDPSEGEQRSHPGDESISEWVFFFVRPTSF